jgi:L-fuculose-phosphate aldolase
MAYDELKRKLVDAGRVLVAEGHDDFTRGHISVRLPDDPSLFLMKPHSRGLDEITVENILTIDLDGEVVAGTSRRHSEVYIHSEIFKARPDVQCVLHTHPPHAIALSSMDRPLRCLNQGGALFYQSLGRYQDTINLIRSKAMGAGVARDLGQNRAVLLKNHGIAVTARTIEELVVSAIMLEEAARIQLLTEAAGTPSAEFPEADIRELQNNLSRLDQFAVNFDYLVRRLSKPAR